MPSSHAARTAGAFTPGRISDRRWPTSRDGGARLLAALGLLLGVHTSASAQVLRFARSTDTIEVPLQTTLTTQATFEARVKIPASGTPRGTIFHEQANAVEDKSLYVGSNFAVAAAFTLAGNYINRPTFAGTPNIMTPGVWHHIAFVRDGGEERFYLDGVRVYSIAWAPPIANSSASGPIAIGASQFDYYEPAPLVSVDWLRISSVARYSGATAPPPTCEPASDAGTLALFRFNDAPGSTTVLDSGPAAAHGTVALGFAGATAPLFESDAGQNGRPSFTQPVSRTACAQSAVGFSVGVVGPGSFAYQWRKNTLPISTAINPSAATAQLVLESIGPDAAASYDCIVSNDCGSVTSTAATLTVRACVCGPSDVAGAGQSIGADDQLSADDIIVFIGWFFAADPRADIAGSGQTPLPDGLFTADDIIVFINRFFAGC
jgi:hypothetical protein